MNQETQWIRGRKKCANHFGTKEVTIAMFIKKGMPCHKEGKWLYFYKNEIDYWMRNKKSNKGA
jgi:hypothetical protein